MEFALLYEIECPRPWGENSIYDCFWEALEQVKVAEEAGFDVVWSVEHHFLDQFSVASSPEVWLSAVAQHTERIRIGQGVRLLPFNYNHPIRSAEMAAVLDIMSKGRLEFGTGRSASALELEGFGIDPEESRAQWDEALRMIPRMWHGGRVLLGLSEQIQMPAAQRPAQAPSSLRIRRSGCRARSRIPRCWPVSAGSASCTSRCPIRWGSTRRSSSYRDAIRAGRARRRLREREVRGLHGAVLWPPTTKTPQARAGEADVLVLEPRRGGLRFAGGAWREDESYAWYRERLAQEGMKQRSLSMSSSTATRPSSAGPERCVESIRWYQEQGVDQMILLVQAGTLAHDDICDSLRRFGSEVIPKFR